MALQKCKECGHDRSDKAKACPNCGAVVKKTHPFTILITILIAVGLFGTCLSSLENEQSTNYSSSSRRTGTSKANKPTTTITKMDPKKLEELHQWVQDSLTSGAIHSINVEYNEVRMDPIPWAFLPIESKQTIVTCFSRYFDLKGSTGRVTILSKYSDEKLASYSVWTGVKIYK